MTERDAFADRKRAQEEEYFRKKDRELLEKMQREAALDAERQQLAQAIGVGDQDVLRQIQELGYSPETIALLPLAPAVQVAWAEGNVTGRERAVLFEIAAARGVGEGTPAYARLDSWLAERPSGVFVEDSLRALRAILQALPAERQEERRQEIVADCRRVAEASGGLLGLGRKVSDTEQQIIDRIAAALS